MNLRTAVLNVFRSSKQKQVEKELLAALNQIRGPSRGVEILIDAENPVLLQLAAAAQQLVKDHPELTLVDVNRTLTLAYRDDMDPTMNPETYAALVTSGHIRNAQTKG